MEKRISIRQKNSVADIPEAAGAVLFINYDPLPLFGHLAVFYKACDGEWHITQFEAGKREVMIGAVETAAVFLVCCLLLPVIIPYGRIFSVPAFLLLAGMTSARVTDEKTGGRQTVGLRMALREKYDFLVLYGDYTYMEGEVQKKTGRRLYSLLWNNCTHYAVWLLKKRKFTESGRKIRRRIVPASLLRDIENSEISQE